MTTNLSGLTDTELRARAQVVFRECSDRLGCETALVLGAVLDELCARLATDVMASRWKIARDAAARHHAEVTAATCERDEWRSLAARCLGRPVADDGVALMDMERAWEGRLSPRLAADLMRERDAAADRVRRIVEAAQTSEKSTAVGWPMPNEQAAAKTGAACVRAAVEREAGR